MRVGLFGGTFDPPHHGHLMVAEAAREQAGLDRIVWMPAAMSPFKEQCSAPEKRLAMVQRAIENNPTFSVSDLEIRRGEVSFTIDTLRAIRKSDPNVLLFLLIGADSYNDFAGWREPDEIRRIAELIVYPRADADSVPSDGVTVLDAPRIDVSATEIRRRVSERRSIRYLVPESVRSYIQTHGLYR